MYANMKGLMMMMIIHWQLNLHLKIETWSYDSTRADCKTQPHNVPWLPAYLPTEYDDGWSEIFRTGPIRRLIGASNVSLTECGFGRYLPGVEVGGDN